MRSTANRIFHALSFELGGLAIITPLGALALGKSMGEVGWVMLAATTIATLWTGIFNLLFDNALVRLRGTPVKTGPLRLLHAGLFELGLMVVLVPLMAWALGIGLVEAFLLDLGFAIFYMVYALAFNWGWERIFPWQLPQSGSEAVAKR